MPVIKFRSNSTKKGQAAVEMAIFGSIILFVLGALLSYMQNLNDQQYIQMEAFRQAKAKAKPSGTAGSGGSVVYRALEDRRYADTTDNFRKGTPQKLDATARILWSSDNTNPNDLIVFKVNDNEVSVPYKSLVQTVPGGYWAPVVQQPQEVSRNLVFSEQFTKAQNASSIGGTKSSRLQETIHTAIPYKLRKYCTDPSKCTPEQDKDGGMIWDSPQGSYIDADGQYKYSKDAAVTPIIKQKSW